MNIDESKFDNFAKRNLATAQRYTDGSAHNFAEWAEQRAGWGLVWMTGKRPMARAFGPVPEEFGQTSQSAEWLALLAATEKCQEGQSELPIVSDCRAVIGAINEEKMELGCRFQKVKCIPTL